MLWSAVLRCCRDYSSAASETSQKRQLPQIPLYRGTSQTDISHGQLRSVTLASRLFGAVDASSDIFSRLLDSIQTNIFAITQWLPGILDARC